MGEWWYDGRATGQAILQAVATIDVCLRQGFCTDVPKFMTSDEGASSHRPADSHRP